MLARFGLQLGQDELRAAHWNPQNNETLELWFEKNVPSPHDCVGICAPGGILQRMATPWADPGLIPDDCLALMQCDPRLDLVDKAYWEGEMAASTSLVTCFAIVLPTRRLNTSPTTIPRTPPSGFFKAINLPKPRILKT